MLYVVVLLLSLQFRSAIAFLAKDPSAIDFRVEAPHLAIAAYHAKVGFTAWVTSSIQLGVMHVLPGAFSILFLLAFGLLQGNVEAGESLLDRLIL
jgi:hypothetical protein